MAEMGIHVICPICDEKVKIDVENVKSAPEAGGVGFTFTPNMTKFHEHVVEHRRNGEDRKHVRFEGGSIIATAGWCKPSEDPPLKPLPEVWFLADCDVCDMTIPFRDEARRDEWVRLHSLAPHGGQIAWVTKREEIRHGTQA